MPVAPSIARKLLQWYDAYARTLPWRAPPGSNAADPYRVWMSEIMLQQTTVAAVIPYFERFTTRWPTVDALAAADEAELMAAWAGLGYYARARNLVACARAVTERGGFPDSEKELRKLPGLGAYTAAAVAAIAFGRRAVVVDANVERVVARLFDIREPLPAARTAIRQGADTITPDTRAGDFAQAMMDLGSSICTSRSPKCPLCPLREDCRGFAAGDPERLPVKPPKRAKPLRIGTAFWAEHEGRVWLVQRPGKGMLGGMRALPDDGWRAGADGDGAPPADADWRIVGSVAHGFTHFDLTLDLAMASLGEADMKGGVWWPVDRITEAGMPTLFMKAARLAMERGT